MSEQSIIFLGPLSEVLGKAKELLIEKGEAQVLEVSGENFSTDFSIEYFPSVIISSNLNTTLQFIKFFKEPYNKTSSKFILACPEKLDQKRQQVIFGLNVSDVIDGQDTNAKTLSHKAMLQFKTLPKLEDSEKGVLKFKHLEAIEREKEQRSKKAEIDYESVDFMAVTKYCDNSLRKMNVLEEMLEDYEERGDKSIILKVKTELDNFKSESSKNSFNTISEFVDILGYLCDKIPECNDVLESVVSGVLFNSVDFLRSEIKTIKEKKARRQILDNPHKGIFERYRWISEKLVNDDGDDTINKIMDSLGIERD